MELHNMYCLLNIMMIKSKRMRWMGHTACMGFNWHRLWFGDGLLCKMFHKNRDFVDQWSIFHLFKVK